MEQVAGPGEDSPLPAGAAIQEKGGDGEYEGTMKVEIGPITVSYNGTVSFEETDETDYRAVLRAAGHEAGGQGTASATIVSTLREEDGGTRVDVETDMMLMWAHAPTLKRALDGLLERGGRGLAAGGIGRRPHLCGSFVNGYHGLERGGRRAVREYDTGPFGAGVLTFLASEVKPLQAPLALLLGGLASTATLSSSARFLRRRA